MSTQWWNGEQVVNLGKAGACYPIRVSPATVYRHATKGNRYGIVLESFLSGGTRATTVEAVNRFVDRTNIAANSVSSRHLESESKRAAIAETQLRAMHASTRKR